MIYSHLYYSTSSWGNAYPTNLELRFKLQKRTIRIVSGQNCWAHSTYLFLKLNILKFDIFFLGMAVFLCINGVTISYQILRDPFFLAKSQHSYKTRNSQNTITSLPELTPYFAGGA